MKPTAQARLDSTAQELYAEISTWPIYDPHSHINPHRPAARNFDEVLGYHYYTELAHSAGMPAELVAADLEPRVRAKNLAARLRPITNTVQYSWLEEIAREFHGWEGPINEESIDKLFDLADHESDGPAWDRLVWECTGLEKVFLTNEFDDPLEGWDRSKFVPCLRTDDLVLKLGLPGTVSRLRHATNQEIGDLKSLKSAIGVLFERFVAKGARACAISLPPSFLPHHPNPKMGATQVRRVVSGLPARPEELAEASRIVFWMLAEFCSDFRLPFDLMIGPIRNVYPAGVVGGRDLFDRRVSLYEYHQLFNHFAGVKFPISTLAPDASGELAAYSWIFPNVIPMGHWWYSNTPATIAADLRLRLEAVPRNKIVGYYSDAYKLEFVLPKFRMYRRIMATVLATDFVEGRGWTKESALELAREALLLNPYRIFEGDAGGAGA